MISNRCILTSVQIMFSATLTSYLSLYNTIIVKTIEYNAPQVFIFSTYSILWSCTNILGNFFKFQDFVYMHMQTILFTLYFNSKCFDLFAHILTKLCKPLTGGATRHMSSTYNKLLIVDNYTSIGTSNIRTHSYNI